MSASTRKSTGPGEPGVAARPTMVGSGETGKVPHLSLAERAARGKAERAEVSRTVHGEWSAPAGRHDPVELLEQQAASRVPELVPIRYGRMLVSPLTFYRGAAYLMAADLAGGQQTGLRVQLCGDAHLSNFGAFAAPDRRLVFDLNDFDETLPGPFEWDLKRLVASFAVAGRDLAFSRKQRREVNMAVTRAYRDAMRDLASMKTLDLWYSRVDAETVIAQFQSAASAQRRKLMEKNLAKTRAKDSLRAFSKLTTVVDGEPRIISDPPLIVPVEDLAEGRDVEEFARAVNRGYRRTLQGDRKHLVERFRYVHAARKVVGVGSVGTRAWIMLLVGRDNDDPLFLQLKEAEASVLEPFVGKSQYANHGQRVVEGQRLMQAASDIMLGWHRVTGVDNVKRDFYFRQLWDEKGSVIIEGMKPRELSAYADICGRTLARAHARSGDAVTISAYLGTNDALDQALADFAELYADQTELDYAVLTTAVKTGRVKAQTGL
ncbi:MAG: DUF2252 domain-containing protein [Solirubrobacteraceae bacterium]